jgi:hypothetical protein
MKDKMSVILAILLGLAIVCHTIEANYSTHEQYQYLRNTVITRTVVEK